jgi:hypothetical protein
MFQIGETYKMKTFIHDFLDEIIVVDIYTVHGTTIHVMIRPNGQIYHMTERDLAAADYYRVASSLIDDMTDNDSLNDDSLNASLIDMTDNEYDSLNDVSLNVNGVFDPNEIFIDFDLDDYEPPQM